MSIWGTLDAQFHGEDIGAWLVEEGLPRGTESGPDVYQTDGTAIYVTGRLRDVDDLPDSPAVLAWFVKVCDYVNTGLEASLLWEIDGGPRYRYEWRNGNLTKLRGVLD